MKKNIDNVLNCFHHIHYSKKGIENVHHCGRRHKKINSKLDYKIHHCFCGKHSTDKKMAIGHVIDQKLKLVEVIIEFSEKCSDKGWHIESGKLK